MHPNIVEYNAYSMMGWSKLFAKWARTDQERKAHLSRHRLDYETAMVVAAFDSTSDVHRTFKYLASREEIDVEKTLPASLHMSHLLKKKVYLQSHKSPMLGFVAETN
jgi:hypothetical protein